MKKGITAILVMVFMGLVAISNVYAQDYHRVRRYNNNYSRVEAKKNVLRHEDQRTYYGYKPKPKHHSRNVHYRHPAERHTQHYR